MWLLFTHEFMTHIIVKFSSWLVLALTLIISSVIFIYVLQSFFMYCYYKVLPNLYINLFLKKAVFKKSIFCGWRKSRVRQAVFIGHDFITAFDLATLLLLLYSIWVSSKSLILKTSTYSHNNATFGLHYAICPLENWALFKILIDKHKTYL